MKLTAAQRNRLPDSAFALSGRRYPIENKAHAKSALAYSSRFATPGQKAEIRRKVHERFPSIKEKRMKA